MRFSVNFQAVKIDVNAYRNVLDRVLSDAIERGATAWLNATVLSVIPVWSGASRGTFLKLARAVSFPLTITGLSNNGIIASRPNRWGPQVGFQKSKGSVNKDKVKSIYTFTYETDLFHLVFNEFNNANQNPTAGRLFARLKQPGPYNFQELGKKAFEEFSQELRLPNPWRNVNIQRITLR